MMYAAVLHGINDIRYGQVALPDLGNDDVLIRVKAAAVCGSDVPRVKTKGTYHFPTIPCHEFSGDIAKVGKNVASVKPHERVAVFPLIPCGNCTLCKEHKPNLCDNYNYLGSRCDGAFAEYVKCPAANVLKIPDTVSYKQASLIEPMAVALRGTRQAGVTSSTKVVVFGMGTLGLGAVQWAKLFGSPLVVGVDRNSHKLAIAKKIGADYVIDSGEDDSREESYEKKIRDLFGKDGPDVVLECSGANAFQNVAIKLVKKSGTISLLGNPQGETSFSEKTFQEILRKELTIRGVWNSLIHLENNEWDFVIKNIAAGNIDPARIITHTFSLRDAKKVFDDLHERNVEGYCKGIFLVNQE